MTPSSSATQTRTITATRTATPSSTASFTPTVTNTPPPTRTPTATFTRVPTWTPRPTNTATASPTPRPTRVRGEVDPLGIVAQGDPPAQKLAAAVLIFPLVRASATTDTRIELASSLTTAGPAARCFYVTAGNCVEIGFSAIAPSGGGGAAARPLSWMVSSGLDGNGRRIAPPFQGDGELKCFATSNSLTGRAIVADNAGQRIAYSAIAFRKLRDDAPTSFISLDGVNYEACPDRLHFNVLSQTATSNSELVLVPCTQNLEGQVFSSVTLQYAVINELEQTFSGASSFTCMERRAFQTIPALRFSSIGTTTAHLIVRGVEVPVIGLVIERFRVPGSGAPSTSSNEPYLEGSRAATLDLPPDWP